jgi:hypothetical protein
MALSLALWGCFRELESVQQEVASLPALTLEVRDHNDALWDAENTPRTPIFFLRTREERQLDLARHLFLLRGVPSRAVLDDLGSGTLRAATQLARIELAIAPCAEPVAELCARPRVPLEPGARYALVWSAVAGTWQLPIVVSESPAAGAALVETLPGELAARVPINLSRVLLRFDGYLAQDGAHVTLSDEAGQQVAAELSTQACEALGLPAGDCVELRPLAALLPSTRYAVRFAEPLSDLTGAPVVGVGERELTFTTGAEIDTRAPVLRALDCAKDERSLGMLCVLAGENKVALRARSDEAGSLTLHTDSLQAAAIGPNADYAVSLPLEAERTLTLTLADFAGNTSQTRVTLAPAQALAPISIDEVRVDPLGPEPAQEYVELLNFGASNVSMMGFSLTQDPFAQGQTILGDSVLAPGERALVVPPDFDPADAHDGAAPAGVRLLRLARALSLRNEGSALYLRDAQGRRVSAAPALAPDQPGQCIHRVGRDSPLARPRARFDPRSGAPLTFAGDAQGSCTPGAPSGP